MLHKKTTAFATLVLIIGFGVSIANAQKMYWPDSPAKKIQRANFDGSEAQDVVTGLAQSPYGVAVDPSTRKIYWTAGIGVGYIKRANSAGGNIETLVVLPNSPSMSWPYEIALDPGARMMYWTNVGHYKIQRANMEIPPGETAENRTDIQDLVTGTEATGLALDLAIELGEKMYWLGRDGNDGIQNKIRRANLDGTGVELLLTGDIYVDKPNRIALDLAGEKMYWTDGGLDRIQRADLDGSNVEDLVVGLTPVGITLDVSAGMMYWTGVSGPPYKVQRANMEIPSGETPGSRTDIEDLVTGVGPPSMTSFEGIALDFSGPIPTVSEWGLIALTLLLLGAGAILIARQRLAMAARPH